MSDFISDDEMMKLEAQGVAKTPEADDEIISDADMAKMEASQGTSFLDKESPLGPSLRETGQTIHDSIVGGADGITWGVLPAVGAGATTILENTLEGISSITPGTDQNKLSNIESGKASIDDLPGLTPALREKLKGQSAPKLDIPDESMAEDYYNYENASRKEFEKANERSPWAYGIADFFGGIATGVGAGSKIGANATKHAPKIMDIAKNQGKIKAGIELLKRGGTNYAKASPLLAAEAVARSDGNIIGGTDEEQKDVLNDTLGNLAFGIPTVLGMQGVSDVAGPYAAKKAGQFSTWAGDIADDVIENSPLARQAKKIFEYGKEGINPASEKHAGRLFDNETIQSSKFMNEIIDADRKLGQDVGNSLARAEKAGVTFNINSTIDNSFREVAKSYETMQDIATNSRGREIFNRIANRSAQPVTPMEAKSLLDDVDTMIAKMGSIKNTNSTEDAIAENLQKFRKNLSEQMKAGIPQYKQAALRFEEFRRLVPETIISGKTPQNIADVYMGDLKNPKMKIFQKAEDLMTGTTGTGQGSIPIKQAFSQMKAGMSQFEGNEAKRLADAMKNGASAEDLEILKNPMMRNTEEYARIIRDNSDDAIGRRALMSSEESRSLGSNLITAGTGIGQASKSKALYAVNVAGQIAGSKTLKSAGAKARWTYNLPAEKLNASADKMMQMPGLKTLGKALKEGLADPNQAKKNTVLFMIMQHPEASLFFNSEHGFMNEENEE